MSEINNAHGILDTINSIASNRESGRLEINSSGTRGTLLFNDGRLVDARLGSLKGFQAVNAAVSLRDVQFSFVHMNSTPHSGSIGANERVVLKRFFGIEAAEMDETNPGSEIDWNMTPEPVVPLAEVAEMNQDDLLDTPTIEAERVTLPIQEESAEPVDSKNTTAPRVPFVPARVALYLALILALTAGAVGLIYKLNLSRQVASVATTVEAHGVPDSAKAEAKKASVSDSEKQVKQPASKSPSVSQPRSTAVRSDAPSPAIRAAQRDEAEPRDDGQRDVNAHHLAGEWKVINTVQKTAYKPYDKIELAFRLTIKQTGKDFTATGEKFSENGRNLHPNSRTPIQLRGSIDGDKIVATFVEDGRMRRTDGRFVWKLQNDGAGLSGTFVSTAANSSGKSTATKQP